MFRLVTKKLYRVIHNIRAIGLKREKQVRDPKQRKESSLFSRLFVLQSWVSRSFSSLSRLARQTKKKERLLAVLKEIYLMAQVLNR